MPAAERWGTCAPTYFICRWAAGVRSWRCHDCDSAAQPVNREQRARESNPSRGATSRTHGAVRAMLMREPERAAESEKMPRARQDRCFRVPHQRTSGLTVLGQPALGTPRSNRLQMGVESPVVGRVITRSRRPVRGAGQPGRATDVALPTCMMRLSMTQLNSCVWRFDALTS